MNRHVYVSAFLILISCTLCHGQRRKAKVTGQNKLKTESPMSYDGLTAITVRRADFSGDWKLNEAKSELVMKFPLCIFGGGDRGRSKIMKIVSHPNFLTVDVAGSSPNGELVIRREKLSFDDHITATTFVGTPRETSVAKWSDDGQTMIVLSARSLEANKETVDFKVTETWTVSSEGKSIIVKVNSRSDFGEHTMRLVYDKQLASDYRF